MTEFNNELDVGAEWHDGSVVFHLGHSALVGRERELADLREAFKSARAGEPAAVVVAGEAGIGKTRLVDEFAAEVSAGGARVIRGQSVELYGEELAFAPIAGVLRGLLAEFGADRLVELAGPGGHTLSALLPELGGVPDEAVEGMGRLYEVVTSLLERAAADVPLVVIIEDLQWADGPTRDLLRFVLQTLLAVPALLLLTCRDDELRRGHPVRSWLAGLERTRRMGRVDVTRLDREQVAAQLRSIVGRDLDREHVDRIFERTEGVPFYVEELAHVDPDSAEWELPDSLRDLLLVRIEPLSEPTQRLLRVMSVAGQRADHAVLEAVAGYDVTSLEASLREAVLAGVIVVDGNAYRFRHALLHEVLRDDMLPGEKARIHASYARTLEERPALVADGRTATAIAHHWYFAHDVERAFRLSISAADELVKVYAHSSAQVMLERALELWDQVDDPVSISGGTRVDLMVRVAEEGYAAGEHERPLALIKAALDEIDEQAEPARAGVLLSRVGWISSKVGHTGVLDILRRASDLIPAYPPSVEHAQVLDKLANVLMLEWHHAEAEQVAADAALAASAVGADDLVASALITQAVAWFDQGRTADGLAEYERARQMLTNSPLVLLRYYINLSHALHLAGRYTESADVALEGKKRATAVGRKRSHGAMLAGNSAEPLLALGEWDRAEDVISRGLAFRPPREQFLQLLVEKAWLSLWRGEIAAADDLLAEVKRISARSTLFPQVRLHNARLEADLALAHDDIERAWDVVTSQLRQPGHIDSSGYDLPLLFMGARALGAKVRSGIVTRAAVEDDAQWLRDMTERLSAGWPMQLWRVLVNAELAGHEVDAWREVLTELAGLEGPVYLRSYTGYRLAWALVEAGERDEARGVLRRADDDARSLGAGLIVRWIEELARRANISLGDGSMPGSSMPGVSPVGGSGTYGLTAREHEVLKLIAEGRSNREIGEALFISAKTASVHVSNILAKLRVASRGEAAALAYRAGLAGSR